MNNTSEIKNYTVTSGDIHENAVSIEYSEKYILGRFYPEYCICEFDYPDVTTVFDSFDEYKNYFEKTFDEYDEKFFKTKSLIFLHRFEYNYSTKHRVGRLAVKDNVLYIQDVVMNPANWVSPMLANWNIFVTVNKSDIKNIKEICLSEAYENYYENY